MRALLTVCLVLVVAVAAHAAGNPDARIYIDFDPPNYVHSILPPEESFVRAYVCIDQIGEGITSVCFRLEDISIYPQFSMASWVDLGGWGRHDGLAPWELTMDHDRRYAPDCVTSDQEPVVVGYVEYYYWGPGGGCVEVLDSDWGAVIVYDCSIGIEMDAICVLSHGSIAGTPCPAGDCSAAPVEDSAWGTIKSLYR